MYLCSPYLNRMIDSISSRQLALLSIGAFFLFSILSPLTSSLYLRINGVYSFIWFIILYIITAYIRSFDKLPSKSFLLCIYIACTLIGAVSDFLSVPILSGLQYNNPIVAISAFCLFLCFSQIQIHNQQIIRFTAFFAPLSFDVFLIHANSIFARWYQKFQFCNLVDENVTLYIIGVPIAVILIYLFCSYLGYLRVLIFKAFREKEKTEKLFHFLNSIELKLRK